MPQTQVMPTKQSLGEVVGTVPCSWKARSGAGGDPLIISADAHANSVRKIICRYDAPQLLCWQVTVFGKIIFFLILDSQSKE